MPENPLAADPSQVALANVYEEAPITELNIVRVGFTISQRHASLRRTFMVGSANSNYNALFSLAVSCWVKGIPVTVTATNTNRTPLQASALPEVLELRVDAGHLYT